MSELLRMDVKELMTFKCLCAKFNFSVSLQELLKGKSFDISKLKSKKVSKQNGNYYKVAF